VHQKTLMLVVLFALHAVQALVQIDQILRQRDVLRRGDGLAIDVSVS